MMNELGFYTLAGQPKSPRDLIDEVRAGEALGRGSAFISERFNVKEAATLSGAVGAVSTRLGIRKNGNPYLSRAFSEAAEFARRFQPEARRFFDRKRAVRNELIAYRALAHKLARACFFILRDRVAYDPSMLFRS